ALGLKFTYFLGDGIQGDYTYATNQPSWTTVNSAGVVEFTAAPTSATKTVTIKATQIAAPHAVQSYTFTVNKWFETVRVLKGTTFGSKVVVDAMCIAGKGTGWSAGDFSIDVRGPGPASSFRVVPGALFAEWGAGQQPTGWVGTAPQASETSGIRPYVWAWAGSISEGDIKVGDYPREKAVAQVTYASGDGVLGFDPDGWAKASTWSVMLADSDLVCVKPI
ncbi:hypothetical protein PGS49_22975, partial [Yersinia intermedia]|nr:hypothetical protein [Yersinia intermedia]